MSTKIVESVKIDAEIGCDECKSLGEKCKLCRSMANRLETFMADRSKKYKEPRKQKQVDNIYSFDSRDLARDLEA